MRKRKGGTVKLIVLIAVAGLVSGCAQAKPVAEAAAPAAAPTATAPSGDYTGKCWTVVNDSTPARLGDGAGPSTPVNGLRGWVALGNPKTYIANGATLFNLVFVFTDPGGKEIFGRHRVCADTPITPSTQGFASAGTQWYFGHVE